MTQAAKFELVNEMLRDSVRTSRSNLAETEGRMARLRDELSGLEAEAKEDRDFIAEAEAALAALGEEAA